MKRLFDLWPHNALNLDLLEELQAQLSIVFRLAKSKIGVEVSKLRAATFSPVEELITAEARDIVRNFGGEPLFSELYAETFDTYLRKPQVTNAKKLFSLTAVEGLLAAYRLFYVGCSRARTELDVIVPLKEVSDAIATAKKFRELGFEVVEPVG